MSRLCLDAVLERVRDLPALPAAVDELIASLNDDGADAGRLVAAISSDQALTAKTLRLANSSFYGMSRQVVSVADAAAILGHQTVRSAALTVGLAARFTPPRCEGFDFTAFWRHAIGTALCTRAIARLRRLDTSAAFVLGLLHDVGCLALASHFPQQYAGALARQEANESGLSGAERETLGTDHGVVGGLIAEHWRFPSLVVDAIVLHHAPHDAGSGSLNDLVDLVHVADNMAHALDLSRLLNDQVPPLSIPAWIRVGLVEDDCLPMFGQIEAEHAALCAALQV